MPEFVPTGNVVPNDYNPNAMSPAEFDAFCIHVDKVGFMHPIAVAAADRNGVYTIVDGEHRHKYLKLRGVKEVPIVVMPKDYDGRNVESMLASLRFNIHGTNDGIQLGEVYKSALDNGYTSDTLAQSLGQARTDIERVAEMLDYDYSDPTGGATPPDTGDDEDEDDDEFIEIFIAIPKSAWEDVVEPEIRRVMRVAGISHDTDEAIEFGQAIELMAVQSSQTPDESLT